MDDPLHPLSPAMKLSLRSFGLPALLALLTVLVYLWNLGGYGLLDPEEGRCAEVAREMAESGDFANPRLNYLPDPDAPLLHCWLTGAAFRLLGEGEGAARLTSAAMGFGGILLTYLLARRMTGSAGAAGMAAMVLAASALWFTAARLAVADTTLTFFLTLALLGYFRWFDGRRRAAAEAASPQSPEQILLPPVRRGNRWLALFCAGTALAALTGPAAAALPIGIALLHLLLLRQWAWARGLLSFLKAALWLCLGAATPFLGLALAPWTGLILDAFRTARGKGRKIGQEDGLLLGLWAVAPFALLPLSGQVLGLLPCMPPVAVLMGAALASALRERAAPWPLRRFVGLGALALMPLALAGAFWPWLGGPPAPEGALRTVRVVALAFSAFWAVSLLLLGGRRRRVLPALYVLALGILLAFVPAFTLAARQNSQRDLALAAQERDGTAFFVAYRELMPGLPFYLRRRVAVAEPDGAAAGADPQWFMSERGLRGLWNGPKRVLLAAWREDLDGLRKALRREPVCIGEFGKKLLFTNF